MSLIGHRSLILSWISAVLPEGRGRALVMAGSLREPAITAALKGYDTLSLVEQLPDLHLHLPNLKFAQNSAAHLDPASGNFDLVVNCHRVFRGPKIGSSDLPNGDLQEMSAIRRLLKPGGIQIACFPLGRDAFWPPECYIYGTTRLPRILEGYRVTASKYYLKDWFNRWVPSNEEEVMKKEGTPELYNLGCFILIRDGTQEGDEA